VRGFCMFTDIRTPPTVSDLRGTARRCWEICPLITACYRMENVMTLRMPWSLSCLRQLRPEALANLFDIDHEAAMAAFRNRL